MSGLPSQVTLLGPTTSDPRSGNRRVLCKCACGKEWEVRAIDYERGRIKSCGCTKYRELAKLSTTHGHSSKDNGQGRRVTKEYDTWQHILGRCADKTDPNYGGRGVKVCQRWLESFEAFLADVGPAPSPSHTIERVETDGDYEPGNCRWATVQEQNRNKRTNRPLTYNGRTLLPVEWAELLGWKADMIYMRLHRGWSVERTLSTPPRT